MTVERPRVTVFTVVNDQRFLDECLASLLAQAFPGWNWVVTLHGGTRWRPRLEDERIHVLIEDPLVGAGALKRAACSGALGEILVELEDHAMLSSDALEQILHAFDADPQVGLVYSSNAFIGQNGSPATPEPDPQLGWTGEEVTVDGHRVRATNAFASTPHNVSSPWYAPGHLRAFRRTTYELAGGYDASQDHLADEDLLCRLYQHADFHHIPRCLYLVRGRSAEPSPGPEAEAMRQSEAWTLYHHYIEPNALAWARRLGLLALDLVVGDTKAPGYVGVSPAEGPEVDIVGDISKGLALPDSSVGVVRALDVLPRVADKVALFNELYRLLGHGGLLLSLTPSTDGRGAFQDPLHVAYYNEDSFWYFTDIEYARFVPSIKCRFQVSRLTTYLPSEWHEQHQIPYICANLIAIKDGPRQGGILNV